MTKSTATAITTTHKFTALYSRLSKGDKDRGADESGSIKKMTIQSTHDK